MTTKAARRLLGSFSSSMSDDEIDQLCSILSEIAELAIAKYEVPKSTQGTCGD